MPSLLTLPGKLEAPGFLQLSPPLQKYISSYFFYLLYLFWGKKLLQAKLGVQTTATVSPQCLTLLLPLAPQKPGGGLLTLLLTPF